MFIQALFIIYKPWKEINCLLGNNEKKTAVYTYNIKLLFNRR